MIQALQNLSVAGSVAGQTFQRIVLRQPPPELKGPFRVDRQLAVTHNAKFQVTGLTHVHVMHWGSFAWP